LRISFFSSYVSVTADHARRRTWAVLTTTSSLSRRTRASLSATSRLSRPLILIALASFYLVPTQTNTPALARGGKITPEALQLMVVARAACDTANDTTFDSMKAICEDLALLSRKSHRFPSENSLRQAQVHLFKLVTANVYRKNPILIKELAGPFKDDPAQLIMVKDLTLTDNQIRYFRENPPTDWLAPPGSIAIIHNDVDRFLVWAAGLDCKPLRDEKGKVRLVSVSVTRL
jgi:hypothetical protein